MIRRGWTIRTRLALLYGAVILFTGTSLLGVTFVLIQRALQTQPVNMSIVLAHTSGQESPEVAGSGVDGGWKTGAPPAGEEESYELARNLQADFRQSTLETLLTQGGIALGGLVIVGAWIGWLVAGSSLRPIRQLTATARRVAGSSLHERAALLGPRDELRELAVSFNDMLSRLDAAFDRQRRFIANASHELKTPLAINRALVEVTLDRPDLPPDLRELRQSLLEVNSRQEMLIDGLLALARSDQPAVNTVPVDLSQITRTVMKSMSPQARRAGLRVSVNLAAAPMAGDPVLLERLVLNLVQNATKYNTPGGDIWLTCESMAGGIRLVVANTGPVLDRDELSGVFEPFQRLGNRVGSAEGAGLGLSIVRSIARAHSGEATANPRDGGGLVVTVAFRPTTA